MAFTIKQNDTRPPWEADIRQDFGEPGEAALDLTTATTVMFKMRPLDGSTVPKIDAAATIVSPLAGTVRYTWAAGDTDTPGDYQAEIEITWSDGGVQTVPNVGYFDITIVDDLDA